MRPIPTIAILACLALPAWAQDDRAARLDVARGYVEATLADIDMGAMISTMYAPVLDQVRASGQEVSEAQVAEIDALYQETFTGPMREIMLAQDEIMADLLTLEEIQALADFYATDAGSSVMRKLPEMTARQQPQIMALIETTMPTVIPQLQEILGE